MTSSLVQPRPGWLRASVLLTVVFLIGCASTPGSSSNNGASGGASLPAVSGSPADGSATPTSSGAPRIAELPFAQIVSSTPLGPQPPGPWSRLVEVDGFAWLADQFGVSRIDPATGTAYGSVSLGSGAAVATDGHRLAIASYVKNKVAEIDIPSLGIIGKPTAIPSPAEIAIVDGGSGWAISAPPDGGGTLYRFTLGGQVTGTTDLHVPHALVATKTAIWLATDVGIARVDPATLDIVETPFVGKTISSLWADGRYLWATYEGVDRNFNPTPGLLRIDPTDMSSVMGQAFTHLLPLSLDHVAKLDSLIWTTGGTSDPRMFEVTRLLAAFDPETMQVVKSFQMPPGSMMLGAASGNLFVASGFNELTAVKPTPGSWSPAPERPAQVSGLELRRLELSDGAEVHVIRPSDRTGLPSIVVVPGGPVPPSLARYLAPLAVALAERGAVVYLLGYQSSASGKTDADALADMQCTVRLAREEAAKASPPDLDHVLVVGHSFGASRAMTLLDTPDMALPGCPTTQAFMPDGVVAAGGYASITNAHVPVVMAYGEGDEGLSEGQRAASELTAAGVPVTFIKRPGIAHAGIVDPRDAVGIVKIVFDLLARVH